MLTPAYLSASPPDYKVTVGTEVALACDVKGINASVDDVGEITYSFLKDNKVISSQNCGTNTYILQGNGISDSGFYTCTAQADGFGEVVTSKPHRLTMAG